MRPSFKQAIVVVGYIYTFVSLVEAQQESYSERDTYRAVPVPIQSFKNDFNNNLGVKIDAFPQRQLLQDPVQILNSRCVVDNYILGFGEDQNIEENGFTLPVASAMGTVGRNRLVATVNHMIEVRTKNGTLIFRDGLADFYNQTNRDLYYPKLIYDEHEGRFLVLVAVYQDRLLLAVSKNEFPDSASAWNFFAFDSGVTIDGDLSYPDAPHFEVDEEAVYITANMFGTGSSGYKGVRLWIVDKGVVGGLYSGGLSPTVRGPYNPYQGNEINVNSLMPTKIHGTGGVGGTIGTFLASLTTLPNAGISLQVISVNNPMGAPTFTSNSLFLGNIGQITNSPSTPQLGTTKSLSVVYPSIANAVWRNNKLWVTFPIVPSGGLDENQAAVHWARVDTSGGVFTVEAQGTLGGESFSTGAHTYYPSVAVNKRGETAFGYSASSPSMYIGAFGSLLLGTQELPFVVRHGQDSYVRTFNGEDPVWGFESDTSVDPVDDSFWLYNMFADTKGLPCGNAEGRWGTAWARIYCNETETVPTSSPSTQPSRPPVRVPVRAPVTAPATTPLTAPVTVPVRPPVASPLTPLTAPVASPLKTPITTPIKATNFPTKAPISVPIAPNVPIVSPPQAPLPKTKPPQLGPITRENTIDIYPGDDFVGIVNNAEPGNTIIFHQGEYISSSRISLLVGGALTSPVIIRNAVGESRPKIKNTFNIEGSTYLTIRGLEILSTGGDGVKIAKGGRDNHDITLDDLVIHSVYVGVNAKTTVDMLHINRTHIYDTSNSGEGMSLGCEDGSCIISKSIIEYNWINTASATQGEGIEINKNSYGNIVRHNVVYNTKYHGILVYGSGIGPINIIEGNVMWNCTLAGIKVAADAIVQNNLVFNSGIGLESDVHSGVSPKNLKIIHNTFINNIVCLFIRSWNGKSDIIFANNAVYCIADTFKFEGGYANVQLSGNVFRPRTNSFPPTSFMEGRFMEQDFKDFTSRNAYPVNGGALQNTANPNYAVSIDFDGTLRVNQYPPDVGAYEWTTADARKWAVTEGFKPFQAIVNGSIPTPVPIALPSAVPSSNQPRRRRICFSGHNTVEILKRHNNSFSKIALLDHRINRENILMSELKVGDYVRSSTGHYTRVISFCHRDPSVVASFIQIHSLLLPNNKSCMKDSFSVNGKIDWWDDNNQTVRIDSLDRNDLKIRQGGVFDDIDVAVDADNNVCNDMESLPVLELSHDHMVYVYRRVSHHQHQLNHYHRQSKLARHADKDWVRAVDVEIGDILIHRRHDIDGVYYGVVTDITTIQRNDGVYSPITTSGSLFVSNTLVSSYVAVLQTPTMISSSSPTDIESSLRTMMVLFPPNVQHMIAHITLTPIRLLCQYDFVKYCQNEVYDNGDNGYAWYSQYILYYVDWLETLGMIVSPHPCPQWILDVLIRIFQWTSTIVIMIPFVLLYLFEVSFSLIMNGYYDESYPTFIIMMILTTALTGWIVRRRIKPPNNSNVSSFVDTNK